MRDKTWPTCLPHCMVDYPSPSKQLIFLLLFFAGLFAILRIGTNYTFLRFSCPIFFVLVTQRLFKASGTIATVRAVVTCVVFSATLLLISPEIAIAFAFACVCVCLFSRTAKRSQRSATIVILILGFSAVFWTAMKLHGTDITLVGLDRSYLPITRFSIQESDGVTSISDYLKAKTIEDFGVTRGIEVIPNFVNCDVYTPIVDEGSRAAARARFAEPGEAILVHLSNFRPVKRVVDVVKVFSLVVKEVPAQLLLVGDGPDRSAAEWLAHAEDGLYLLIAKLAPRVVHEYVVQRRVLH